MRVHADRARPIQASGGEVCCSEAWEQAYQRFETREEECRKFVRRLRVLGSGDWPRAATVVELFCGRGSGLDALSRLGFANLEGVDLSGSLIAQYRGPAVCHVADCRRLPFADGSKDILIVQGGLHHLEALPADLDQTLREAKRVLRPGGHFVVVEPWMTPFLKLTHFVCSVGMARLVWPRLDALATMIDHERATYEQWLGRPQEVLQLLKTHFAPELERASWGKLMFVGRA